MADTRNNGGPAFPRHQFTPLGQGQGQWSVEGGMTLRDWFAGQALAGCYAGRAGVGLRLDPSNLQADVDAFYTIADAMLAAREALE